jgi:hypothetical protein
MTKLAELAQAVRTERDRLDAVLRLLEVDEAPVEVPRTFQRRTVHAVRPNGHRKMTPEGRRRIQEAQRARWEKFHAGENSPQR